MKSRRRRDATGGCALAALLGAALAAQAACPAGDGRVVLAGAAPLALSWQARLQDGSPVAPGGIPPATLFQLDVALCEGMDAADAVLSRVDATMPEHRHGMNYRPRIVPTGTGRFRVEGLMLHMSGHWRIEFELDSANTRQRLFHDLQVR